MKILAGSLKETLYAWPEASGAAPLAVKKETVYTENQVTYMSDQLGLHRISNPDPMNVAVSLHCKPLAHSQLGLLGVVVWTLR